jgi:hypothetical protein
MNLRLSKRDSDRLAAHAFLRRLPPTSLAREIVLAFLDSNEGLPGYLGAFTALAESDAAKSLRGPESS